MVTLPSSAVYSVVGPISKQTNLSVHDLISGTGAMVRLAGGSCEACSLILLVSTRWMGLHSFTSTSAAVWEEAYVPCISNRTDGRTYFWHAGGPC